MSLLSSFEFASLLGSQELNTWFLGPKLIAQTVPPWHIGHDSCGPPTAPPVPFAQVFVVRGLRGVWSVKGGSRSMFLRSHPPYPWKIPKGPFTNSFCLGISFFRGVWGSLGYLPRVCGQVHWMFPGFTTDQVTRSTHCTKFLNGATGLNLSKLRIAPSTSRWRNYLLKRFPRKNI